MCGRAYSTFTDDELYFRYLNRRSWHLPLADSKPVVNPNYNLCPTQNTQIFSARDGTLGFHLMRWGLVPGWAKTVKDADKYSMINAKAEEIAEKRSYKAAFRQRRCIVPLSGFFEWKREGNQKTPYAIRGKGEAIISLAGIWESWQGADGETVDSFSIVTTAANEFMQSIHTRMPVILTSEQEQEWINLETGTDQLNLIMKGCASEFLEARPVSNLVNSTRNNSPEVLS